MGIICRIIIRVFKGATRSLETRSSETIAHICSEQQTSQGPANMKGLLETLNPIDPKAPEAGRVSPKETATPKYVQ